MSSAPYQTAFSGRFVISRGDDLEAFSIQQHIAQGAIQQNIRPLNGDDQHPASEQLQHQHLLRNIQPNGHRLLIRPYLLEHQQEPLDDILHHLRQGYHISVRAGMPILHRPTVLIDLRPRDAWRYGYRFWLDRDTAMILRTQLLDEQQHSMEQLLYVSLHLNTSATSPLTYPQPDAPPSYRAPQQVPKDQQHWFVHMRPAGFHQVHYYRHQQAQRSLEQIILSDGLNSASIFIENDHDTLLKKGKSMGTINAYGLSMGSTHITAIGEIPMRTAKHLAESITSVPNTP